MEIPVKITGEIPKRDAGLIVVTISTYLIGKFVLNKDYVLGVILIGVGALCTLSYLLIYLERQKDKWDQKLFNLSILEEIYKEHPYSFVKNRLISEYERLYYLSLEERKHELAKAFKSRIEELKKEKSFY